MKKISTELAIKELAEYLSNFSDEFEEYKVKDENDIEIDEVKPNLVIKIKDEYKKTLRALSDGRLTFDNDLKPIYQLISPINVGTEFELNTITFKTRILPTVGANLARGVDLKNDASTYSLVVICHIIGLASKNELDKLNKRDYELARELAMVFI